MQVISRPRTTEEKQNFYRFLCAALEKKCGIAPSDVMVGIVENTDGDWSFGNGAAQFLIRIEGPHLKDYLPGSRAVHLH